MADTEVVILCVWVPLVVEVRSFDDPGLGTANHGVIVTVIVASTASPGPPSVPPNANRTWTT